MVFVGVFSCKKDFEIIKREVFNKNKDLNLININYKNIKNLVNVKFNALILNDKLDIEKLDIDIIQKICKNIRYLIINSDQNNNLNVFNSSYLNVINYGLNHKCTINPSSIKEDSILLSLQREIIDIYGNLIEIGDYKIKNINGIDIYGNILVFILEIIYDKYIKK